MVRGQFSGGNCMGGNFPRVQLSSGTIVWGRAILKGAIIQGTIFLRGNCPRTFFLTSIYPVQLKHN